MLQQSESVDTKETEEAGGAVAPCGNFSGAGLVLSIHTSQVRG